MTKNLLFWFQIIVAWIFTFPQIRNILIDKTQGLTLALYSTSILYNIFSLSLAISSYRVNPDKIRKQTIIIFLQWLVFTNLIFIFGLKKIIWRPGDTLICIIIFILSTITVLYYKGIKDPFSRGFLSVWCKSIPQLWLGYTMLSVGSSQGLPLLTLIAGYLLCITRMVQVLLSALKGGWDGPIKGLFLGESSNVFAWTISVIIWTIFRI